MRGTERRNKKRLILISYLVRDETALRCDFAEYYHISRLDALPIGTAAALAAGLREPSRSYKASTGLKLTLMESMSAMTLDALNLLCWMRSEDARHNRNRPKSVYTTLTADHSQDLCGETIEDFDRWYAEKMG